MSKHPTDDVSLSGQLQAIATEVAALQTALFNEREARATERHQFERELTRLRTIAASAGTIEYVTDVAEDRLVVKCAIGRTALMYAVNPEEVFANAISYAIDQFRLQQDLHRRMTDPAYRAAEAFANATKPPRAR